MPVTGQDYYFDDDAEDILIENDQLKRSSIMKIWLLKPIDHLPDHKNPWFPIGGKVLGMVVVAATEDDARQIAHNNGGDENRFATCPWKDPQYSRCTEVPKDCKPHVILQDYVDYERH